MGGDPIREALFALLDGDAELAGLLSEPHAIFHLRAPASAEFPYAIFHKQSGLPIRAMGGGGFKNQLWLVKGLCRGGDQEEAEAIDERCEALLDNATFDIAGFELLSMERETDVPYPEDDSGFVQAAGGTAVSATTEVRHALAAAVAEIAPAVVIAAGKKYDEPKRQFALRIVVGDPSDETVIEQLDEMLDDEGPRSVKATLDAANFGGAINSLWVARNSGHRLFPAPGAAPVLGAEWLVDVL
jgi:hypothetical protein